MATSSCSSFVNAASAITNYSRLSIAYQIELPNILRELLFTKEPPHLLEGHLRNNPYLSKNLKAYEWLVIRTVHNNQYNDFDVSLMYKIIRNLNLITKPTQGWDNRTPPSATETTEGDDVERIRRMRNTFSHRGNENITDAELAHNFSIFKDIANRFETFLPNSKTKFVSKIENLETCCIDKDTEQMYLNQLRELAEKERKSAAEIQKDFINIKDRVSKLEKDKDKNREQAKRIRKNEIMEQVPRNEIRLVTIGKTGNGKSSSCNTILGQEMCETGCSNEGVTTDCMVRYANRFGKLICLVDTPGIQDSRRKNKDVQNKIHDCIKFSCPGPHAIILVVPIGRFTDEDVKTVDHFCSHFGKELEKYVIVLFTRFDDLKREMKNKPNHPGMKGFIEKLTPPLKDFLSKCGNRYVEFDNTLEGASAESQVQRLIDVVDNMVRDNGGLHYTDKKYQDAEIELQTQIAEIKQKNELERMKIEEKMRKEISDDIRKQYEQKQQELIRELERIREKAKQKNWFDRVCDDGRAAFGW